MFWQWLRPSVTTNPARRAPCIARCLLLLLQPVCDNFPLLLGASGPLIGFLHSAHSSVNCPFVKFFSTNLSSNLFPAGTLTSTPPSPGSHHCHTPGFHPRHLKSCSPQDPPPNQVKLLCFLRPLPICPSLSHYHQNLKVDLAVMSRTMFTQAPAPLLSALGTKHPRHGMFGSTCVGLPGPQKRSPWGALPRAALIVTGRRVNLYGPFSIASLNASRFPQMGYILLLLDGNKVHRANHKVSTDTAQRERQSGRPATAAGGLENTRKQSPSPPLPS